MAYVGPELLAGDHLLEGFDRGKPALNLWLIRYARKNQTSGSRRTWVVCEQTPERSWLSTIGDRIDTPIVHAEVNTAEPTRRDACRPARTDGR